MKYISRIVEIEAEKIIKVDEAVRENNAYGVTTETGRFLHLVSSQEIMEGDYVNVTDPEDIYHMPAKIIDGPNAKYGPIE